MSFWLWIVLGLLGATRSHTFDYFDRGENVKRPTWDSLPVKPIVIEYNEATPSYKLVGTVLPVNYEKDKPPTPNIFNNAKKNGVYDGGHVLAVFLGGPNKDENIVAQPARWQESGSWSDLEKQIEKYVKGTMGAAWANGKTLHQYQEHNACAEEVEARKKRRAKDDEERARSRSPGPYRGYTHRQDVSALFDVPQTLVDIEIEITEWQSDKGTTENAKKIPKMYKGKLTCRGAVTESVEFSIEQPQVEAQPTKSMFDVYLCVVTIHIPAFLCRQMDL